MITVTKYHWTEEDGAISEGESLRHVAEDAAELFDAWPVVITETDIYGSGETHSTEIARYGRDGRDAA